MPIQKSIVTAFFAAFAKLSQDVADAIAAAEGELDESLCLQSFRITCRTHVCMEYLHGSFGDPHAQSIDICCCACLVALQLICKPQELKEEENEL